VSPKVKFFSQRVRILSHILKILSLRSKIEPKKIKF